MAFVSVDFNPPPRTLRNFGLIGLVAFGALALLAYRHMWAFAKFSDGTDQTLTYVLGALAAYCGLFAIAAPAALKWLYIGLSVVGFPIGFVFSYIIVTIMFFVVIVPTALIFRLIGRDAMKLKYNPQATSYWIRRTPPHSVKRYFRQF